MVESCKIKEAVRFLHDFFKDFSLLMEDAEAKMEKIGYVNNPDRGRRISELSNAVDEPGKWVLDNYSRQLIPKNARENPKADVGVSVTFQLCLYSESLLTESALLCYLIHHSAGCNKKKVVTEWWGMPYLDVPEKSYLLEIISGDNKFATLRPRNAMETIERFSVFGCDVLSLNTPEKVDQLLIEPVKKILAKKEPKLDGHIIFPEELLDYWRDPSQG